MVSFTPTNYSSVLAGSSASVTVAIPGGAGADLLITNMTASAAVVLLSTSSTTTLPKGTAAYADGVGIPPGGYLVIPVASNTFVTAISVGFGAVNLSLAQGTAA